MVYILEQYDRQSLRLSICDFPSCSTTLLGAAPIIGLFHTFVFILLEVLVNVLTLCVLALLHQIHCLQNSLSDSRTRY